MNEDSAKKICKAKRDVPYTSESGLVVWKNEPCRAEVWEDSNFCMWHQREECLRPEDVQGFVMPEMKQ